ncbi:MAG: hypothetical protein IT530_21945, partial [Burkholderiales bacterium]|nr:hypothetical protein [Burkholderiales bacterium]
MGAVPRILVLCAALGALAGAPAVAAPGPPIDVKIGMSTPADPERNGVYVWIRALAQSLEHASARVRVYP